MKGNDGKPIYKKWWFWLLAIIIVGGIGGALDEKKDEAAPAPTKQAATQPKDEKGGIPEEKADATPGEESVAEPAPEKPAEEASAKKPIAKPSVPAEESADADAITSDWQAEIEKIASSDSSATEKADAAALLKNKVTIGVDEEKEFREDIIAEYKSGRYLSTTHDDLYPLMNIFKASLVEDRSEGMPIGDFAFDFLQNTQYVYRGAETPESDSVKSNEEQMDKALAKMK
ncbi:hypothetical protein B9G55_01550 [Saccharibacillus sp. O16]|nr:hypothetical protein B9G55_01550 [Saccharibacillus sp. O16]